MRDQEALENSKPPSPPPVWVALIPVAVLVGALYITVVALRSLELTTHTPMIIGTIAAAFVALKRGYRWQDLEQGMVEGISLASKACLILLLIGMLVGSWIQAGIVPAMIYYGLTILTPSIFLIATCVICALVSLATGSSWSTSATVGVALIGIGEGLGVHRRRVAGAIISGAYFGDKMSPLSDTTNLAPAMSGANLFDHIRHMAYTTGPALLLSLMAYWVLGQRVVSEVSLDRVESMRAVLQDNYLIHPLLLLPPLLIIVMVLLRIPALPAILGGWGVGAIIAGIVQGAKSPSKLHPFWQVVGEILLVSYRGVRSKTGHLLVDGLLSRGGLSSMFSTVVLVLCAMSFGGVMEKAGLLESLANAILLLAKGTGGLVASTVLTCLVMNVLGSDQYLSIVVPGRMFRKAYERQGLAPRNLSRVLEDSGTLTSVLIPWNTCGAFMIATLGLEPWTYVPFCFLNLLNPLISILYGFLKITMTPLPKEV